ncbi:response regulator [Candidatus Dependentiae bacterium]|nr:response regulator [Candidatus Dependentiae bacterium]
MENANEIIILMAEDDDGHAELIKENLYDAGIKNKIIRFNNGTKILNFLYNQLSMGDDKYNSHLSYLILLDIQMPEIDGIEVLKKIKSDPTLKKIPIIMLTTTDDHREIQKCYELGCNCYITKPVEFNKLAETLRRLGLFILVVKIPDSSGEKK